MEGLQNIGVIIDTALAGLVVMFAIKSSRKVNLPAPAAPSFDVREVEQSLRKVIADAEEASHDLSRTLQKRQKSLEQVLFDLENVEQRASKALEEAGAKTTALNNAIEAANNTEIPAAPRGREHQKVDAQIKNSHMTSRVAQSEASSLDPLVVESDDRFIPDTTAPKANIAASSKVNIFGEIIPESSSSPRPLARQIEVEQDVRGGTKSVRYEDNNLRSGIYRIYDTARDLLNAGHSVAQVCATTKLPAATVRKIEELVVSKNSQSEIFDAEITETPIQKRDARLGALGDMRRSREVIS